jgi:monoamine oxidase
MSARVPNYINPRITDANRLTIRNKFLKIGKVSPVSCVNHMIISSGQNVKPSEETWHLSIAIQPAIMRNNCRRRPALMTDHVSRREFLNLLGAYGGSSAVLSAGAALGLMPGSSKAAEIALQNVAGSGKKVAILGTGISGLTTAWELTKAGYDCTVLEASHRAGGRVFTVRSGTVVDEIGNYQRCDWDDDPHMYFNAGAARIPSIHSNTLKYCKELQVDLEVFVNESKTAWIQDDALLGGKPVRNTDFTSSMQGFISEILAKALSHSEINAEFNESEIESLLGIVRSFGDLNEDMLYEGSIRAGYATGGFLDHGSKKDVIALRDLIKTRLARSTMVTTQEGTGSGPVLLQPVGGMDRIIYGFANRLGDRVKFRCPVTAVMVNDNGVDIAYEENGSARQLQVDYCFNCIPSHLMTGIPNNFPAPYMEALKYIRRGHAYKAAFQAKERFWEKEGIYAGISWVNAPIQQIWYPPQGIHKDKGIILAAYNFSGGGYTELTQSERVEDHLTHGEKVHSNYRQMVEKPITVAWHRMNHMLGCAPRWSRSFGGWSQHEEEMYEVVRQPVNGRHYMIGDQITQHSAWMESAIQSAHYALEDMDQRVRAQSA